MPRNDISLEELAAALPEYDQPAADRARSPLEERVLAGFEEIQRWVTEHGHPPRHGEGLDIFERLCAVRLDRIRQQPELRAIVEEIDHQDLLTGGPDHATDPAVMSDEELAAELVDMDEIESDITALKHVRSRKEIEAAEEVASRRPCSDFDRFRPLFDQVKAQLETGVRATRPFGRDGSIEKGQFFIVNGQTAYVAERGENLKAPNGAIDARLRVIYSNGTESNLLLWSLQRALYKDDAGRRITEASAGPLFDAAADADQ